MARLLCAEQQRRDHPGRSGCQDRQRRVRGLLAAWQRAGICGVGIAAWHTLRIPGIDIQLGFFPRSTQNAALQSIADDIRNNTTSSLFFSLAFLYQTPGPILDAIQSLSNEKHLFCYGISDHAVKSLESLETSGVDLRKPDGIVRSVHPAQISGHIPPPFSKEPVGGSGTRMHHKFVVIDYNLPSARVYTAHIIFRIPPTRTTEKTCC